LLDRPNTEKRALPRAMVPFLGVESKTVMHAKRTVAVVVSILLLAVSSSASLCEISCSLSKPHPVPHFAKASSLAPGQGRRSALHSHCGQTAPATPAGTTSHTLENISRCSNVPCAQAAALSSPLKVLDGAQIEKLPLAPLSVLPHPVRIDSLLLNVRREAARREIYPPNSHSVDLRI
jgi:hypothetical protein